jgi:hypothetical protein
VDSELSVELLQRLADLDGGPFPAPRGASHGRLPHPQDGRYEFFLTAPPVKFRRALGSPVNPLAIK